MAMQQSNLLWLKQVECPLCYEEFTTENIWQNRVSVVKEYPDLGKKYAGANPLFYSVWVCPNCYYADFRGDEYFDTGKINDEEFEDNYDLLDFVAKDCDFKEPRTFSLAVASYKLAIVVAKYKKSSLARIGTFNLRLAWLYRTLKKTEQDKKYVKYALDYYLKAFTTEDQPDFGALSTGGIYYLLGELHRQMGDLRSAVNFFQKVVNDKNLGTEPKYIRLARFQWESLKDMKPDPAEKESTEESDDAPQEAPEE
jgi:uncharacterized protein (DUF2225 family)